MGSDVCGMVMVMGNLYGRKRMRNIQELEAIVWNESDVTFLEVRFGGGGTFGSEVRVQFKRARVVAGLTQCLPSLGYIYIRE